MRVIFYLRLRNFMSTDYEFNIIVGIPYIKEDFDIFSVTVAGQWHTEKRFNHKSGEELEPEIICDKKPNKYYQHSDIIPKESDLNEVVKVKKPKNSIEYTKIISDDMDKIFKGKSSGDNKETISIPTTYALYQNYPNPFNPTTKIAYDIPRDAKVKLVIYDILGREMKTLVNNEFRSAGKYITEFNGSNLASGIYFARILVNEGKDFISVKKMVLIK